MVEYLISFSSINVLCKLALQLYDVLVKIASQCILQSSRLG